ncbi:MAG: phosphatidylserine decarboxylase family protein [Ignavibacteriaceae bacterium]|nr:phosphatidylserine decarboxylase family protein [Ignavibacteriaceae bacterium]
MFTKYGYSTLGIITIITFVFISIGLFVSNNFLKSLLIILPVIFLIFSMYFFRDPERTAPKGENILVSPADGKVLLIKDVYDNKYINGKAKQISIFMSPLNVHVNRIPISGKLEYLQYHKGEFVAAFNDKASENNERCEFGINSKYGKVLFTQVAGAMARRIVYEIKPGDTVKIGERFGMIKFGSRVDVVVPEQWTAKVKKGEHVSAGETILFENTTGQSGRQE